MTTEEIRALALETGVSEDNIRMIIRLVGPDRASIIRETRLLAKSRRI